MYFIQSSYPFAMTNSRRSFTDEQKLEILRQAEKIGVTAALREHRLSYSVFTRWKQKFLKQHADPQTMMEVNRARSELKQFKEENTRLKKIIADQALELERKDEVLKKNLALYGKDKPKSFVGNKKIKSIS
jgi:putative transposase